MLLSESAIAHWEASTSVVPRYQDHGQNFGRGVGFWDERGAASEPGDVNDYSEAPALAHHRDPEEQNHDGPEQRSTQFPRWAWRQAQRDLHHRGLAEKCTWEECPDHINGKDHDFFHYHRFVS